VSGKGGGVTVDPSPKNWVDQFPDIQLKPFQTPMRWDAVYTLNLGTKAKHLLETGFWDSSPRVNTSKLLAAITSDQSCSLCAFT